MLAGVIEVLSTHFALGWACDDEHGPVHVVAECDGRILGISRADMTRPDLDSVHPRHHAYIIVFLQPVAVEHLEHIRIRAIHKPAEFVRILRLRQDDRAPLQIFVLGSPRSGTSELGSTLTRELALPWLGEGHAAPAFATAATALAGDVSSPNSLLRFMAQHTYPDIVYRAARQAYYWTHASASFLDKTPGVAMIRAVRFLRACFPDAYYIFMRRNGISNVLSREAKFGGSFDAHCQDWAAAMDSWMDLRGELPHYLEVEQERMLSEPAAVARAVAGYVGRPEAAGAIAQSLSTGSRERTGAGIGRASLADTAWSAAQIAQFRKLCGPTMTRWGYPLDG
jgi:hypothetical protein